jgi:hypothetical protein
VPDTQFQMPCRNCPEGSLLRFSLSIAKIEFVIFKLLVFAGFLFAVYKLADHEFGPFFPVNQPGQAPSENVKTLFVPILRQIR